MAPRHRRRLPLDPPVTPLWGVKKSTSSTLIMPLSIHPRSSRRLKNFRPAPTPDPDPQRLKTPWRPQPPAVSPLEETATQVATPARSPRLTLPTPATAGRPLTIRNDGRAGRPLARQSTRWTAGLGTGRATQAPRHGPCAPSIGARRAPGISPAFLSPAPVRREEFLGAVRGGRGASLSPPRPQARRAPARGRRPRTCATSPLCSRSSTAAPWGEGSPTRADPGLLRYRADGRSGNVGQPGAWVLPHRGRSGPFPPLSRHGPGPGPTLRPEAIGQRRAA